MKKIIIATGLALLVTLGISAQTVLFTPGRLAVLRIGDGAHDTGNTNQISDWNFKQNPIFIDEFDPNVANAIVPTVSVAIPTNGNNALFLNGNAGSEAEGCTRSMDRSVVTTTGYHGDILSQPGTPSNLPYLRGISVIDAFGTNHLALARNDWYGFATGKTNPRGVVSDDGVNNFWGSGNVVGTLYYNPALNDGAPQFVQNFAATRSVKILNNTLYTTIIGKDALNNYPPGIYNFVQFDGVTPSPLPTGFAGFHLVVPAFDKYTNIVGFYLNPQGNIAYVADMVWGIQKYIKTGGQWQFACNYSVQGYEQTASGLVITNDVKNGYGGCWDVVADFSGTNPVLFATTWDYSFYNGNANSNRIVRMVDTNTGLSGLNITNFTVVAQATGTNIGFRALDFTPDLRPLITSVSDDQSVVAGTPATFSVTATASVTALLKGPITYQWVKNATNILGGQTSSNLTFSPVLADNGTVYQCIASDFYGSVTSTPPINLTVTATPVAPFNAGSFQNLTNTVGDGVSITVTAGGTTPLSYQWFAGTTQLSDTGRFSGTTNRILNISGAQFGIDDTNYFCLVTNNAPGSSNILAAKLTLVYAKPAFSSTPSSTTVLSNTPAQFSAVGFGSSLSYQWYSNNVAVSGATANTFAINPATLTVNNIKVVVTNPGGSVTSPPITLTVILPPPHSFVNYTNTGQVYVQNFDSLPVVTNSTVNADNPVDVYQVGANGNFVAYSIDNPFDFAYPILVSGGVGGLGLSNSMPGWYGWGQVASHFGAHQGDQSKGGIIDFGTLSTNANLGGTNRAVGLLSTSTTGSSAMGVKLINHTTNSLSYITLKYIGEIWRNQPVSNSLVFSYYIDLTGTNAFSPTNDTATFVSSLDVNFNTNADGLLVLDGTQSSNQVSLAATNLAIGSWPTNAALWLVWQQLNSAGGAQGMAIDNLSFSAASTIASSATAPNLRGVTFNGNIGTLNAGLSFSFTNAPGTGFTVWATTNLMLPFSQWLNLGHPTESPAGQYQFVDSLATNQPQRFYRVTNP